MDYDFPRPGDSGDGVSLQSAGGWAARCPRSTPKGLRARKEFLCYLYEQENFNTWIAAAFVFNQPPLHYYEKHPVWNQNPKTTILPKEAEYARARGWPAKPNEFIQIIDNNFILPNMAAKVVTGTPVKEAIAWGENEVRKVLEGKVG